MKDNNYYDTITTPKGGTLYLQPIPILLQTNCTSSLSMVL